MDSTFERISFFFWMVAFLLALGVGLRTRRFLELTGGKASSMLQVVIFRILAAIVGVGALNYLLRIVRHVIWLR